MRILQVSDIHGSMSATERIAELVRENNYDLVIVAGDVTNFGTVEMAETILGKINEAGAKVLFVAGNCDPESMLRWQPSTGDIVNIHLKTVEVGGLRFMGLGGGGPRSVGTWIEFGEEEFRSMLDSMTPPSGRFVLVSHTPPHGCGADDVGGKHVGSVAIREFVEKTKPLLVSCGHIHEARSVSKIGETVVVNAGPARSGNYARIRIEGEGVEAELERF